jgi:DNA-binding LacI/PurR family transcriptional regulator
MSPLAKHLKIKKDGSEPYYLQLEKKLQALISSGKIKSGDQLPPESEISEICGVSRVTVRQALKRLEKNSIVYKIPGKGTFAGGASGLRATRNDGQKTITIYMASNSSRFHPYSMQLLEGIERQASLFDFSVLITSDLRKVFTSNNTMGVILTKRIPLSQLKKLKEHKIPFVLTHEHSETYKETFPAVCLDSKDAGYNQTKCLINLTHSRIAIFTGILDDRLKGEGNRQRVAGYKKALEKNELVFDKSLVKECDYDNEKTIAMTKEILRLKNPPTAIIAADDIGAGIIINTLRSKNIRVPEDISVVGMGDLELTATISPPLTTFRIPVTQIGERAFSLLYQVMKNEKNDYPIYVHGNLVVRESCANKHSDS